MYIYRVSQKWVPKTHKQVYHNNHDNCHVNVCYANSAIDMTRVLVFLM